MLPVAPLASAPSTTTAPPVPPAVPPVAPPARIPDARIDLTLGQDTATLTHERLLLAADAELRLSFAHLLALVMGSGPPPDSAMMSSSPSSPSGAPQ